MNLSQYLNETGTKKSDFARAIGVSPALLHQWLEGIRPVAIPHCVVIERVTGGHVSRKDLRPSDWADIWPDLLATPAAPAGAPRRSTDPDHPMRKPPSRAAVMECAVDQPGQEAL